MQISKIGVGSLVHSYNALLIQHPVKTIGNIRLPGVEVCK